MTTTSAPKEAPGGRAHGALLWLLLALFCLRVLGQLAVAVRPSPLLPPFDAWHSGTLPYPALVVAQVGIVALFAWMARGVSTGRTRRRPRLGRALIAFGCLYFASMLVRLVLGATLFPASAWWHAPIPSVFHLVLAAFLMVAGHYHITHGAPRTGIPSSGS